MRAPDPGWYEQVADPIYRSWPYPSSSHVRMLANRTPAHAHYAYSHPDDDNEWRALGRAEHMAVLEPERFEQHYASAPPGLARNRKEAAEVWQAAGFTWGERKWNHARDVLSHDDYQRVLGMRDALHQNETTRELLLGGDGRNEVSLVWDEHLERGPLRCKARIDRLTMWRRWPTLIDLKTSSDASRRSVPWDLGRYGYHLQAAMYLRALAGQDWLAGRELVKRLFLFVFIESSPPFLPVVYRLDQQSLDEADAQLEALLEQWARCAAANDWPGYPQEVQELTLPQKFWRGQWE